MRQAALSIAQLDPVDLPDVQAETPAISLELDAAGIADLRYPLTIHFADGTSQQTVANATLAASVSAATRGVHMSRFVEILHEWHAQLSPKALPRLLADVADRLIAEKVQVKLEFPLFFERAAPTSGGSAFVVYDCALEGHLQKGRISSTLMTRVPITSLCPCSREISDYGAHNQRGSIEMRVSFDLSDGSEHADFTDLIAIAERTGSAPIYSLLKRTDERYVTMRAYENPAFVEDIVRAVAAALKSDEAIQAGRVRVVNEESIHTHNAFAAISWTR